MGPPPEGGGEEAKDAGRTAEIVASMGPPPEGGGEHSSPESHFSASTELQWGRLPKEAESRKGRRDGGPAHPRFNGAASRRRRRGTRRRSRWSRTCSGFNGAASRRRRRGGAPWHCIGIETLGLQWGRLPKEAERTRYQGQGRRRAIRASMGPPPEGGGEQPLAVAVAHVGDRASMGPPPEGGGEGARVPNPALDDWLQWGRLPKEAERSRSPPVGWGRACFNGAASRRRRRVSPDGGDNDNAGLQWGRLPKEAERILGTTRQAGRAQASMGPPPEGGGESPSRCR